MYVRDLFSFGLFLYVAMSWFLDLVRSFIIELFLYFFH